MFGTWSSPGDAIRAVLNQAVNVILKLPDGRQTLRNVRRKAVCESSTHGHLPDAAGVKPHSGSEIMASDSESDVPLGQRASQAQAVPKPDSAADAAKPPETTAASAPADDEGSDDEPIGAKFAATKLAPGMRDQIWSHAPAPPPLASRYTAPLQQALRHCGKVLRRYVRLVACAAGEPPEVKAEAEMQHKQAVAAAADGGGDAAAAKLATDRPPSAAGKPLEKPAGKAAADTGSKPSAARPKV